MKRSKKMNAFLFAVVMIVIAVGVLVGNYLLFGIPLLLRTQHRNKIVAPSPQEQPKPPQTIASLADEFRSKNILAIYAVEGALVNDALAGSHTNDILYVVWIDNAAYYRETMGVTAVGGYRWERYNSFYTLEAAQEAVAKLYIAWAALRLGPQPEGKKVQ